MSAAQAVDKREKRRYTDCTLLQITLKQFYFKEKNNEKITGIITRTRYGLIFGSL